MIQGNNTTRPSHWEEEAPAESSYRRVQQVVPRSGRALPGMPQDIQDTDEDDGSRSEWARAAAGRFQAPPGPWWRPASTVGRVFLTLGALVVLAVLGAGGLLLNRYVDRDARFRIAGASDIQATGLTEVSRADMLPVFGEDIGRNVFHVPLGERRKQLEAIPWVERATVMRLLPDQIRIHVVERQPVAFTRQGQQIGLVDANGVLLTMPAATMALRHYSFPVVTGINPGDTPASRKARMAVYGRLMAELDGNGQRFSEQISEIDLTDPEDARVLMPEQGEDILAHFGDDRFLERYQRYKAHITEWRQQYPKLAEVDLRYDQQVVLEMASGANATQPDNGKDAENPAIQGGAASPGAVKQSTADEGVKTKPASGKPAAAGKNGLGKAPQGKSPQAKSPLGRASTKSPASSSARAKMKEAKIKQVHEKKRAEARRAALNANKRRQPAVLRPAAAVAEGQ